jgi:hypothetical protein
MRFVPNRGRSRNPKTFFHSTTSKGKKSCLTCVLNNIIEEKYIKKQSTEEVFL